MRLVISRTPLRVSFVGGGSDLSAQEGKSDGTGTTVSSSIDKYIYAIVKWRHDDKVIVHWRERECVFHSRNLKHDLIREILISRGINRGIEVATFADVSGVGSGLGSSAATTVGVLHAVLRLQGMEPSKQELAEMAGEIEIGRLKRHCGRQDQYASAIGGLLLMDHVDGQVKKYRRIDPQVVLGTFSNLKKDLLNSVVHLFAPQDGNGRDAEKKLSEFDDSQRFRSTCNELCSVFTNALQTRDFDTVIGCIRQHHILKQTHFSYMDLKTECRLNEIGAAFKLCGAGGTGHLLVACLPEVADEICPKFEELWGPELPFKFEHTGSMVIHTE